MCMETSDQDFLKGYRRTTFGLLPSKLSSKAPRIDG